MRLRPYTAVLPKPLMPIGDRPVLDIVIRQLRHHGFDEVTIATGYLAELIEAFFRDGHDYDIPISYHREHSPLGTAGALRTVENLDEPFLVMNGDVLTDMDYGKLIEHHCATDAAATIATVHREIQVPLGVLKFHDPHQPDRLTSYEEKPSLDYEASMGVYAFSPRVLDFMEPDERIDFPDLIARLLDAGEPVRAYRSECYWLDIGRHDDYETALDDFERMRHRLIPDEEPRERRYLDDRRTYDDRRDDDRREGGDRRRRPERRGANDGDVVDFPRAAND
jgi:NDP-sugar pyrophosphorylase family protein